MEVAIETLTDADIDSVEALRKRNATTLGFFPYEALREHLRNRLVLGAKTQDNILIGYLLFAKSADRFRIAHLCVDESHRGHGVAKNLFNKLKELRTTQTNIRLSCRRDFPANAVWQKLDCIPIDDKQGRSKAGHLLTVWQYDLVQSNQLEIFRSKIMPEALDVVLDAQVFFDFEEPPRKVSEPSKALFADFLVDTLELWVTNEILVEINRNKNSAERNMQRQRAETHIVSHNPAVAEHYSGLLRTILPARTDSQKSDIQQLAKTAASSARIFVTRDRAILRGAKEIEELAGIRVISPAQIIVECHEISEKDAYVPSYVSGQDFAWLRISSEDIAQISWEAFLRRGERLNGFKEVLFSFVSNPEKITCEILRSGTDTCAVRVIEKTKKKLVVHLARAEKTVSRPLFERFLVTDAMYEALADKLPIVEIESNSLGENLITHALEIGFLEHDGKYYRLCLPSCLDRREEILSLTAALLPCLSAKYRGLSASELEQCCSPADLEEHEKNYVIAPIKPGYAISLFDRRQAESDLFGGEKNTLLRWDNVYYRRISHQNILRAPARILWYESAPECRVTTLSSLDDVDLGTPRDLLHKYRKLGVLKWSDLYDMCSSDADKKLMALKFSSAFPLYHPVPLARLRDILKAPKLTFQSPRQITRSQHRMILRAGFE